jgi:hypothetical protein
MTWDRARIFWLVTLALLVPGIFWAPALWAALAWSVLNLAVYRLDRGSWGAFPVQVRVFYILVMLPALWPPLQGIVVVQALGTFLAIFADYCPAARIVSLFPWNRDKPLSASLVWHTFARPPVQSVLSR